jgi:hypothetical protein
LVDGVNWRLWNEYAGVGTNYSYRSQLPLPLHYDSISNPTFDILFGMPREIGLGAGYKYANVNLVNKFYYKFLTEITSKNSKLVRAYFRITPSDWYNLQFKNLYFFEGQYWRLNKVENYNPTDEGVYLCEFLLAQFIPPFTIVQNKNATDSFCVVSTNTTFQAGTDGSAAILCEDFEVSKPDTLYIGNYEMYPNFLSGGAVKTLTTSYTATKDDYLFLLNPATGGMVLTLPNPTGLSGKYFAVKKITAAHTVTIETTGTAKIDGADTHSMSGNWAAHEIVTDGIDYFLMGEK